LDITDAEEVSDEVERTLEAVPYSFWTSEWRRKSLDTPGGWEIIKEDLKALISPSADSQLTLVDIEDL